MNIFSRWVLFVATVIKTKRIQKEAVESYNRRFIEIKEKLLHDTSVPDEDLAERMVEEANNLRICIREECEEKMRRLLEELKSL